MPDKFEREAEKQWTKEALKLAGQLGKLGDMMSEQEWGDMRVRELRARPGNNGDGEVLVIVKGTVEGRNMIAFNSGASLKEALAGLAERVQNNTLKWRDDLPYEQKGS